LAGVVAVTDVQRDLILTPDSGERALDHGILRRERGIRGGERYQNRAFRIPDMHETNARCAQDA
jgi:hypothetical protein